MMKESIFRLHSSMPAVNPSIRSSFYHPPLLIEALSLLMKIFGNNITIARSFIIITGFFTLVFTYLIVKELFNYRTAFFSFIIAGINVYLFPESKLVHSNMPSLVFVLFTIYGGKNITKQKKYHGLSYHHVFSPLPMELNYSSYSLYFQLYL